MDEDLQRKFLAGLGDAITRYATGSENDRLRRFLEKLRAGMLEVVYWIDDEYNLPVPTKYRRKVERELSLDRN